MTYTDAVVVAANDYAVFRCFTEYTVSEVDYLRMVQYFVHRDDVDIELIEDSETPNIKSLTVWNDERVVLLSVQSDSDGVNNNAAAVGTSIDVSTWSDIGGVLVTPYDTISAMASTLFAWKNYNPE
jgi:hypothetical protein